ncbi:MAG: hypothetical protein R3C53_12940 [Pirellulaceae bacterium]
MATADSQAEAMLVVEGLLRLDTNVSSEIVHGLSHPNPQVARTSYRTLDAQITRWQELDPTVSNAHLRSLAEQLNKLPASTPANSFILASSLASRIYTTCLQQEDPQLAPTIAACEAILQRAGHAAIGSADTSLVALNELSSRVDASMVPTSPPPPLPIEPAAVQATGTASMRLIPSRTRLRASEVAARLPSSESATLRISDEPATATETSFSLNDNTSHSLSDADEASQAPQLPIASAATSMSPEPELPVFVNRPASLSNTPLVSMRVVSDKPNMDGIQDLSIEELVRLLGSVQPNVVKGAALALRSKGFDDTQLALASELSTGSAARRLELVQTIARESDDPRPWLLWMAEDGEPEVRKLSTSLLSSMVDPFVERSLRILLSRETDPEVERALRQALLAARSKQ